MEEILRRIVDELCGIREALNVIAERAQPSEPPEIPAPVQWELPRGFPAEWRAILSQEPKLLEKIDFTATECWVWRGMMPAGYPSHYFKIFGGKRQMVRRVMCQWFFGERFLVGENLGQPICKDPRCINPFHTMPIERFNQIVKTNGMSLDQMEYVIDRFTCFQEPTPTKTERTVEQARPMRPLTEILADLEEKDGVKLEDLEVGEESPSTVTPSIEEDEDEGIDEDGFRTKPAPLKPTH